MESELQIDASYRAYNRKPLLSSDSKNKHNPTPTTAIGLSGLCRLKCTHLICDRVRYMITHLAYLPGTTYLLYMQMGEGCVGHTAEGTKEEVMRPQVCRASN